jgi:hypothetical protein
MTQFLVTQKKSLNSLHLQPFKEARITVKLAENLLENNATGKSLRISQQWMTRYEISLEGDLYVIDFRDSKQYLKIQEGSDL